MLCCVSKKAAAGADLEPPLLGLQFGKVVENRGSVFAANVENSPVPQFAKEKAKLTLEEGDLVAGASKTSSILRFKNQLHRVKKSSQVFGGLTFLCRSPRKDVPSIFLPCAYCTRTLNPLRLETHEKICQKSVIKKRKPFDSAKQRIQGTELEEFRPKPETKRPQQEERIGKQKTSSWKQTHDEFLRTIRAARGEPIEIPSRQTPNHVASGAPTRANEKGTCPTCYRQFGIKAYDRHVAWCKERLTRLPLSPATNLAKERLEARIRYRAPALKNRRPTIREKYMPGSVTNLGYIAKSSPPANALKAKESVSLPNCNKGDSPAKQKPAVRRAAHGRDSSIPSGPVKSRPIDRVTRPLEDLQSESARTQISSFSSSSKHPVPPLNPGTFMKFPITSNANDLSKFELRAITDPISQRKNSNLIKTQKLNLVSARSLGNPKLSDVAMNNDQYGLMIQPCCIHQEHEFVTWRQISKGNFESKENLYSKRNLSSQRTTEFKNNVSKLNLLSLTDSQDQEEIKKTEKSKSDVDLNTTTLNENELFDREVDTDLRTTTWMNKEKNLDETYVIKEDEDHLDIKICVLEVLKTILSDPKITKDLPEKSVSEINSEICVSECPELKNISKEDIFIQNPVQSLLEELHTELDSLTGFNDNISFTSTPNTNRFNKEYSERNSESSGETVGDMIENESLSLEDLDTGEWKKNLEFRDELINFSFACETVDEERDKLLKEENQKNIKMEKKIPKNQIESVRVLDFTTAEFNLNEDTLNNEKVEFEKKDENESFSDSVIQNIEKKDSSRQRSGTYIIEKPFIIIPKYDQNLEVRKPDFQFEEPLQKRRRTNEDFEVLDYDNRNLEKKNLTLIGSLNSKCCDLMNKANITIDESFGGIYDKYVNKKLIEEDKKVCESESKLNLIEENCNVYSLDLKLRKRNECVEENLNEEIFSNGISHTNVPPNSELLNENIFYESKLLTESDQFIESAFDLIDNDYEVRAEDSLESIVTKTKNLKINDEESNCSTGFDLQKTNCKEHVNEIEKSVVDTENDNFKVQKFEESKNEDDKVAGVESDLIQISKEKEDSFIRNKNDERKKLSSENKIKAGTLSRSNIPRQISRPELKLNSSDQFWKKRKKKDNIPSLKENLPTLKHDLEPNEQKKKSKNLFFEGNVVKSKLDPQIFLKSKSNFSHRPLKRNESIYLCSPENFPGYFQVNEDEKLKDRESTEIDEIEDNEIKIANPKGVFQSKSLSSFTSHDNESVKLNSAKLEKNIRRSLNLLRGSTDILISSVEDIETDSKTPSMVDFFIDETCTIEEIQSPQGSTRYKLLPVIGQDSKYFGKKEPVKNNSSGDSYWERASRVSMRRLIGSEAVQDEGEFKLTKRNPRVNILPPVACSTFGEMRFILPDRPAWNNYVRRHPDFFMVLRGRTGNNKTYDPFFMAEQQMRDLLSDTSDISSIDGTSTQPNSTHYPLTHSSAFVKYPSQTLPSNTEPSKKRASLIAPPSEFDDLTSDFSSDCTETNSISHELFVNDLVSQTSDAIANATNKEKSPSRDHILGRKVIIDKSKALGSDIEDSSRGRNSIGSVEKTRKILENVSGSKIIRPMVNRSHSVRAASAPKIPERKSSTSSESSGSQKKCMKSSKSSDLNLVDRRNNNHSNNNSSSYASTMNGSNLSLNSIVSSDVDIKRSNSMFDELMSSFEDDSSTILPSLRSLLKSDPLSMSSPIQSNHKRNGQLSDDELSSPDSYKRQDHSKLSADSAYSSLNRKYYTHGRSTNDMASRLDEDPPPRCREGDSRFMSKKTKFCHDCGSKFPENAKFCCECGVKRLTL